MRNNTRDWSWVWWIPVIVAVVVLLAVFAGRAYGQEITIPSTAFTRNFMRGTNANDAGQRLWVPPQALWVPPTLTNTTILCIATNGTTNGIRGQWTNNAFSTPYDILQWATNGANTFVGAVTAATNGDTIVFTPGTYTCPAIPLNYNGLSLNLWVMAGARVARATNYLDATGWTNVATSFNAGSTGVLPGQQFMGPFIVPGVNSVVRVDGIIDVQTNNTVSDSVYGWNDSLPMYSKAKVNNINGIIRQWGFTNFAAPGSILYGTGSLYGNTDVIIIQQTNANITPIGIYGFNGFSGQGWLVGRSWWDSLVLKGPIVLNSARMDLLSAFQGTGGQNASGQARAVSIHHGSVWNDLGSFCGSVGTTNANPVPVSNPDVGVTCALDVFSNSVVNLSGTTLYVSNTNGTPVIYNDGTALVNGTYQGFYLSNGLGSPYLGPIADTNGVAIRK